MQIRLEKLENRFPSPWELYALVILAGAAVYIPLSYVLDLHVVHSPMRLTGFACPLCGGTRAVTALCLGYVDVAVRYNPLAVAVFALFLYALASWLFLVVPFKRRVTVEATGRQRILFWIAVGLVFVANWAYVLSAGLYREPLGNWIPQLT